MPKAPGSGVTISVKGDVEQVLRQLDRVQKQKVPKAASLSLNRARQRVQTRVVRTLSKRLAIKAKVLRGRVAFKAASPKYLVTWIHGFWGGVPLIRVGKARETKTGVKVGRFVRPGAFIEVMRSGHHSVMKRRGEKRLPLKEEKVDIENDADRAVLVHIKRTGLPAFSKEFARQLSRMIK